MNAQVEIKIIRDNGLEIYVCLVKGVEIARSMSEQGCRLQVLKLLQSIKAKEAKAQQDAEIAALKAKAYNKSLVKNDTLVA
jgi:hypothetical protein